jgi:hypothetical protein
MNDHPNSPADELVSPPYPGEGANHDALYNALKDFRSWIVHYRDALNAEVGQEVIPLPREMPDRRVYAILAVPLQNGHLAFMRRVREQWDHLVRSYESAWDCPPCVRQRVLLVQTAAAFFNDAFTAFEQREARASTEMRRMQRSFDRLVSHLRNLVEPEDHEAPEAEDGEGPG